MYLVIKTSQIYPIVCLSLKHYELIPISTTEKFIIILQVVKIQVKHE